MNQVKLKLCGNHSYHDLLNTIHSRADYIGVVFAKSKRRVTPENLREWLSQVDLNSEQKLVGIFVNPEIEEVQHVLNYVPLDIIQAHGNEPVPMLLHMKEVTNIPIWKAIHHEEDAIKKMRTYEGVVEGYVIDARAKGQWGGTGTRFDWSSVPSYIQEAKRQNVPCLIAGGITAENVEELLHYHPDGIDLSSGIETDGAKDKQKIQQLEERLMSHEI